MGVCAGAGQIISCCGLSIVLYQSGNKKIMSDSRVQSAVDYVKKWKGNGRFIVIVDCGVMCCLMSCIVSIVLSPFHPPARGRRPDPERRWRPAAPRAPPTPSAPTRATTGTTRAWWTRWGRVQDSARCTVELQTNLREVLQAWRRPLLLRWVSLGWKSI